MDVCTQHDVHDIQGVTEKGVLIPVPCSRLQLTEAPKYLGITFKNFVLFLRLVITKGRLNSC